MNRKIIIPELESGNIKYITGDIREGITVFIIRKDYQCHWGLCDLNGNIIRGAKYHRIEKFTEGLAAVSDWNFKYGFINKKGEEVIPLTKARADQFSEGLAPVAEGETGKEKYSYIDKTGRVIIKTDSPQAFPFYCGMARIENKSFFSKSGFINKAGVLITPVIYNAATDFSENFAFVSKAFFKSKFALLDIGGNLQSDFLFDSAEKFSDGKSLVSKNGNYGFLFAKSFQFESIGSYHAMIKIKDFAYCIKYHKEDAEIHILDRELNKITKLACNDLFSSYRDFDMIPFRKGKRWGLSDYYGNIIKDAVYKDIYQEDWNIANCYKDGSTNFFVNGRGESI